MPDKPAKTTEFIHLRLFAMPCCGIHICWVNPRLPSHCPECGKSVYMELKFHPEKHLLFQDEDARLVYKPTGGPNG